jgi:hypothetical protein
LQGLPLSIIVVPENMNDSTLYIPTLKNFKIEKPVGRPVNMPSKVTADGMYDTAKIRKYNRRRGIKSNIPVNKRKKKSVIERFYSWIESCKKVFPRYEIKETSYLGVVMLAAIVRVHEVLG